MLGSVSALGERAPAPADARTHFGFGDDFDRPHRPPIRGRQERFTLLVPCGLMDSQLGIVFQAGLMQDLVAHAEGRPSGSAKRPLPVSRPTQVVRICVVAGAPRRDSCASA